MVWQIIPDDRHSIVESQTGERRPIVIEVEMIQPVTRAYLSYWRAELKLVRQVVWLACSQSFERQ